MRRMVWLYALLAVLVLAAVGLTLAQSVDKSGPVTPEVALPAPDTVGTMTLEQTLLKRRSVRQFAEGALTPQQLGQLCWAAQGITDPATGHRTAPSAMAKYPIDLYLFTPSGVFRYVPKGHALAQLAAEDKRAAVSTQASVRAAAVDFVLVGVLSRLGAPGPNTERFAAIEAGHIGQSIHLEAVALGLGSVSVGGFQGSDVVKALSLPEGQVPLYVIPVGKPAGR
jgi:SagB-type dehydrogenase family enzyme